MIAGVTFDWWHTLAETPWPDYDERMRVLRVEGIEDALACVGMHAVWFNTGFWPDARTGRADAEIEDHGELPRLLEGWRR